jgi:hypothetical protein
LGEVGSRLSFCRLPVVINRIPYDRDEMSVEACPEKRLVEEGLRVVEDLWKS